MDEFVAPPNGAEHTTDLLPADVHHLGARAARGMLSVDAGHEALSPLHELPTFAEQAADTSRTNVVRYVPQVEAKLSDYTQPDEQIASVTEQEGLQALRSFLQDYLDVASTGSDTKAYDPAWRARDMLDSLTYIGEKELAAAVNGIAADWKTYLSEGGAIYMWAEPRKSSAYMLDKILSQFSDDELAAYKGSLHFVDDLQPIYGQEPKPLPEKYKIVMVDDWMATGRQLQGAYNSDVSRGWSRHYPGQRQNVEIQLITATPGQLRQGLDVDDPLNSSGPVVTLPIKAYYRTHQNEYGETYVTGSHSSTDDDIEVPIADMVDTLRRKRPDQEYHMPPLTNIVREYRSYEYVPANIKRAETQLGEEYRTFANNTW